MFAVLNKEIHAVKCFGYEFTNDESILKKQLDTANICFLHAPKFHPAMKAVGPTRKALAVKTFFNMSDHHCIHRAHVSTQRRI